MSEQRDKAARLDLIWASRQARVERAALLEAPVEQPEVAPRTAPMARLDVAADGTPTLVCAEGVSELDAILLGMQGLGRLVLDLMSEEMQPK